MAVSEFKANRLAVLDEIERTGKPLLVTRQGKPVVQILPPEDWESMAAGGRPFPGDTE